MGNLRIGLATTDIELVTGMDMTGFLARSTGSTGIHDELKTKCLFFDDGSMQFVLVVNDLLALDSRFIEQCIVEASKKLGISSENIVIACTHTHSGPASIFLQDCGDVVDSWLESQKENIIKCIIKASNNMKPSVISYKTSHCNIGFNRVVKDKSLSELLVDNQVGVMEISDGKTGQIGAVLVNYACHPVVLDGTLYSKDFYHYTIENLKQKPGYENAEIIYTSGCCGDINPLERGDFQQAEKLGCMLAESINTPSTSKLELYNPSIKVKSNRINIPLAHDLSKESAPALQNERSKILKELSCENIDKNIAKVKIAYLHWVENMLRKIDNGTLEKSVCADVKIIEIGDLKILTIPFEAFHGIGLKIKKLFGENRTFVICYANGDFGYFPSKELYDQAEAGYEVGMAYKYYGYPGPVSKDAEDILFNAILKIK